MENNPTQFIYKDLDTEALWVLLLSPQLSDEIARSAVHDELCARGINTQQQNEYIAYYRRERGLATDVLPPLHWYQFKQRLLRDDLEDAVEWSFDKKEVAGVATLSNVQRLRLLLFLILLMPLWRIALEIYQGIVYKFDGTFGSVFTFGRILTIGFYALLIHGVFKKWKFIWSLMVIHCSYVALINLTDIFRNFQEIVFTEHVSDFFFVVFRFLYTGLNVLSCLLLLYAPIANLFAVSKTRKFIALSLGLFFYLGFFSLNIYTGRM
jgi:hypothetical protein